VALQRVLQHYERILESIEEASLRERAADVRDVGRQVLAALVDRDRERAMAGARDYIFAADEFLPGDVGVLDRARVRGIVTCRGGKYSHSAILARSFGIPCVVGIDDLLQRVPSGTPCVLDGERGVLVVEPGPEDLARHRERMEEIFVLEKRLAEARNLPPCTPCGVQVNLMANVDGVRDQEEVIDRGFSGIGLFRTEFVFMERKEFPSEEEQHGIYADSLRRMKGLPVTFRTLDIGGDKPLSYFVTLPEHNPVLGWRGIRLVFHWPDILYAQLRAILRASTEGTARVMLPMVTTLEEVKRGRAVFEELKGDLRKAGIPFDPKLPFGVMIEVPSTVAMLPEILEVVDFVSVGTNDLIQYLLAVDRDNPRVAGMYDPYHPAVLRTLRTIAQHAAAARKPPSICGEVAGDHALTPVLLGLGFRDLSMASVFLGRVKLIVAETTLATCEQLAAQCVAAGTGTEVKQVLRDHVTGAFRRRGFEPN
jgi:phosphoenolpyruvate-protein phosphotransferase